MQSAGSFKDLLQQVKGSSHVYCKDVKLSLENVEEIVEAIAKNTKLRTLVLWNNDIGDAGAVKFAFCLKHNMHITDLGLGKNNIKEEGGIALAKALEENHTLTLLGLTGNRIGTGGAVAFGDSIRVNQTLEYLKLGGNMIGDEGLSRIALSLKSDKNEGNTVLRFLELDMNMITDTGAIALAKALRPGVCAMNRLCLYDNNIGHKGATALKACKKVKVGLFGNPINQHPDPGQATLARHHS